MKTLTCTLPDGRKATRGTKHDYTHAVATRIGEAEAKVRGTDERPWGARTWHSRLDLALKSASACRLMGDDAVVVEVDP